MFIQRLLNQGNAPLLEQVVRFSAARHELIAENIANVDTPGYRQRDLSIEHFRRQLFDRLARRARTARGTVRFDDITIAPEHPMRGILFHDGGNRSMEQLATGLAKNALVHNLAIELLRRQYRQMELALKERVA